MRLGAGLSVGVLHGAEEFERRHEGDALTDAGRPSAGIQLIEPAPGAAHLDLVPLTLTDAWQDQAARILERARAERSAPAAVVPRYANRDMMRGQAPRAQRKGSHQTDRICCAISGCLKFPGFCRCSAFVSFFKSPDPYQRGPCWTFGA